MTIQLTTSELYDFQSKLSEWYNKRSMYVLERVSCRNQMILETSSVRAALEKMAQQFESENPKPDWKTLL